MTPTPSDREKAGELQAELFLLIGPWINEMADNPGETFKIDMRPIIEKALQSARKEGFEKAKRRAAEIADAPYMDPVAAISKDSPSIVGRKICLAIQSLKERMK